MAQPLAMAFSPSGWVSFTIAVGLANSGSGISVPSILVRVLISFTFFKIRGRSQMLSLIHI